MPASTTVPPEYAALVDDAATLPPREAALEDAVEGHRAAQAAPYGGLLGPLVLDDRSLPQLLGRPGRDEQPLPITVVVSGGAGAVEPAVRWAAGGPRGAGSSAVRLTGVEVALRDLDDMAGNARRVVAAVLAARDVAPEVPAYVELPLTHVPDPAASHDWLTALDEVAAADLRLTLRPGGPEQRLVPTSATVAAAVDAALDRELVFRCTAGLHRAVRRRAADTGLEDHGFLNLLLATARTWDGAGRDEVVAVLEERDAEVLVPAARAQGAGLSSARRWFASFGCSTVADPLADLISLELLPRVA